MYYDQTERWMRGACSNMFPSVPARICYSYFNLWTEPEPLQFIFQANITEPNSTKLWSVCVVEKTESIVMPSIQSYYLFHKCRANIHWALAGHRMRDSLRLVIISPLTNPPWTRLLRPIARFYLTFCLLLSNIADCKPTKDLLSYTPADNTYIVTCIMPASLPSIESIYCSKCLNISAWIVAVW